MVDGVAASSSANLFVIPLVSSFAAWDEFVLTFISDMIIIIGTPGLLTSQQYHRSSQTSLDGEDGTKGAGRVSMDSSTGSRSEAFVK